MENLPKELYIKHKAIESLSKELKSLKNEYESLSETVKEYMQHEKIEKIKLSEDAVLHLKERKTFKSISKEYILETLKAFYKHPDAHKNKPDTLAEKTTDTLIENRDFNISYILKFLKK